MASDQDSEWRDPEEASRMCDEAFRRLMKMPPKPQEQMKLGRPRGRGRRAGTGKAPVSASSYEGAEKG